MLTGGLPLGHFAVPSQRAPVDAQTDVLILRALAKEPELRYQHAHEMKAAIVALQQRFQASLQLVGAARPAVGVGNSAPATALWPTASPAQALEDDAQTQILRHQLQVPAFGVLTTGIVSWLWCLGWLIATFVDYESAIQYPSITLGVLLYQALAFIQGMIAVRGAWRMRNLEDYDFATLAVLLAMLPLSVSTLIGIPVGIWALRTLRKPEVIAAFKAQKIRLATTQPPTGTAQLIRFFTSTTNWAIICCFLVLLAAIPAWLTNRHPGMPVVTYYILCAVYGPLVLLLLATNFIEPVPLWRSLAVIAAGADVMVVAIAYLNYHGMREWGRYGSRPDPVSVWVCLCLALGIVIALLGTLQLRGVLMRLYRASNPARNTEQEPIRQ
jgi:hypothetical protein